MKDALRKLLIKNFEEVLNKIKNGTCDLSEDEAMDILSVLVHEKLSKEQACEYLNCSRATFDNAVRDGLIPKGRKRRDSKSLFWYKDELSNILKR